MRKDAQDFRGLSLFAALSMDPFESPDSCLVRVKKVQELPQVTREESLGGFLPSFVLDSLDPCFPLKEDSE